VDIVRREIPALGEDRVIAVDIKKAKDIIKNKKILEEVKVG
jgi:histidine ammonia-lyase